MPNGSRSCASVQVPCREGVCCPALVGTLLREEQWNRNPVSCAEPLLCCSCADHGRLRGIRGIPAQCAREFVTAWQSSVFEWLRDGSSAVPRGLSCVAGWCRSQAFRCNQGLTGALRFRWLLPSLTAQFRCAAALGVPRCIGCYLRKRSCRHTAAYESLSLSVCVATLLHSGSTHRHSQGLQCFLNRSPALSLSGSFQKNLRLSLIL